MAFSYQTRPNILEGLKTQTLDVLIIGGGITGAGLALQASATGLKTGLVEMQDFAGGTSSRSTKLVHGGIRYLKTFDVAVVADTVQERAVVQGVAPHIPKPAPMLLPIYDDPTSTFDMFSVKIAMDLYDRLAGVNGTQYENYTLDRDEVLQREPGLRPDGLLGAGVYLDFVNNDARLVIENIKEAAELGGLMASHVKVTGMLHDDTGQLIGVTAKDQLTGETFDIHAKYVVNATGPWVTKTWQLDDKNGQGQYIRPTKGVHLVVDQSRLSVPQPTYFDSGKGDGRMIFVVPREGKTYFGTTDTDYTDDYATPQVEQADVDYLLVAINYRYPEVGLTQADIEASWAGIRPLIASNASSDYNGGGANTGKVTEESFQTLIDQVNAYQTGQATKGDVEKAISALKTAGSEQTLSPSQVSRGASLDVGEDGLITISGGKITDYRKMAEGAFDLLRQLFLDQHQREVKAIDSKKLQVSGGHFDPNNVTETLKFYADIAKGKGIPEAEAIELANLYGSNTSRVISYASSIPAAEGLSLAETLGLYYAIQEEMVLHPVDFCLRRTNLLLFHADRLKTKKAALLKAMATYLDWSATELENYTSELDQAIAISHLEHLT